MGKPEEALAKIHAQIELLKRSRAMFPHVLPSMEGETRARTAPYYQKDGHVVEFEFSGGLTAESIQQINEIGYWINQNFIFRVYGILDSHGIAGSAKIDQSLDGADEVDILRRLRRVIGHTDGRYNAADKEEKTLYMRIKEYFRLSDAECPSDGEHRYPLPIDRVIIPLAEGCIRYAKELGRT